MYDANSKEPGSPSRTAGAGVLPFDGLVGNLVNGTVAAALLYIADAIGSLDFTPLPDAIEPLVVAAAGTVMGILVTKVLPRFRSGAR
jgi:hypothetical protein